MPPKKSVQKGIFYGSKEKLHTAQEPMTDVYDFDQQDTSCVILGSLQSEGLLTDFRCPVHIRPDSDTRVSRKMLCSTNDVTEASHSGKTSTPYAVTGHQKTKNKILGTPAPWVTLSRLQQNSLAAYTVSPIAVEHNSPNDLSRRINVNSMFDDSSPVLDDSAVFISSSNSEVARDWNDKMSAASASQAASTQHVVNGGEASSQEFDSEKYKSETDSGYAKFDSQCEFISLLAGDNVGMAKERCKSKANTDDLPPVKIDGDSGCNGNIISAEKRDDSDCKLVSYKPGMLDPKKFNSSDARSRKLTTKRRYQLYDDVEPSDESDDSAGVSKKTSIKGKPIEPAKVAAAPRHKPSRALRQRNTAVDADFDSPHCPLRKSDAKIADKVTASGEVSYVIKPVNVENTNVPEKPKSCCMPAKKQSNESGLRKQKGNGAAARVAKEAHANGPDSENGNAEHISANAFVSSMKSRNRKKPKVQRSNEEPASSAPMNSKMQEMMLELKDIAENYELTIE